MLPRMFKRIGLATLVLWLTICSAQALGSVMPQILGGGTISSPTVAPWSVLLNMSAGDEEAQCSGSIIDATHVLTAAHCTYDDESNSPFALSSYVVSAGISEVRSGSSELQQRSVIAVRVEPSYVQGVIGDDLATLTLNQPLNLTRTAVKSIAIVGEGDEPALGTAVRVFGWGQVSPGIADGHEHSLEQTIVHQWWCASGVPSMLCARSTSGATCPGDSGSGLVVGEQPLLVGVDEIGVGSADCAAGDRSGYIDLATAEISTWLAGSEDPPKAPRAATYPLLGGEPYVGGALTCASPSWSEGPSLSTAFVYPESDQTIQQGNSMTYTPSTADLARDIACVSIASNAAGTTEAISERPFMVLPPRDPHLTLSLNSGGTYAIDFGANVTLTMHLAFADTAGTVVKRYTFASNQAIPEVPKLPPGTYRVCVESEAVDSWTAGSACITQIFPGHASELLHVLSRHYQRGHWVVILAAAPQLAGKRLSIDLAVPGCSRCARRVVRRAVGEHTAVASLAEPRSRPLEVTARVPPVTIAGVPYSAAIFRWRLRR
jgi:secreted trypsin-like serine protease